MKQHLDLRLRLQTKNIFAKSEPVFLPIAMCINYSAYYGIRMRSTVCFSAGGLQERRRIYPEPKPLATEQELSDFLKSVEKRAFKRSAYHVRDDEAALDIVQDSMMKLAIHYSDKPVAELPMLFQRILSNTTLDWFRRRKTRNALFSNMNDFESPDGDGDFDLLEMLESTNASEGTESAQDATQRQQTLLEIEEAVKKLPERQREAFLLRYWEEMDVAETASTMGCSEGSVKTHCSRAVKALAKTLAAKGITL